MDYSGRVARLRQGLENSSVDAFLITNLTNVRYLTGFSGTNGQVLITPNRALFMSDPRYAARAADLVTSLDVEIYPVNLVDLLKERLADAGVGRLGLEAPTVTLAQHKQFRDALGVELVAVPGPVEELRRAKEPAEVELIKKAIAITDTAFEWVLERLRPAAVTERDVALDLEVHMRRGGADEVSFEPIVGFGPMSAHIHHTPSDRPLERGDLVLLDFGCRVDGYCSDMTRTVVVGGATDEQRAIYQTVLAAHLSGMASVRAGASAKETDGAARSVIAEAGWAENFGHGLGHGVGLDIHEAPRLHYTSEDRLIAGDVVTIEPGVYAGATGGIRIEDCVLVTKEGFEDLTGARKQELLEI